MRLLGTIVNRDDDGNLLFTSEIFEDDDGRVFFTANADIDADGANGQNGGPPAYTVRDDGSDALANGGMKIVDGRVVLKPGDDGGSVILDAGGQPKEFPGGMIASKTWYRYPGVGDGQPERYVDAEAVPYIVVPPLVVAEMEGAVCGCRARVCWNGVRIDCVVADMGPEAKTGELSIAAGRALGFPSSDPRRGGIDTPDVLYELWPGKAAPGFQLEPAGQDVP